MVAAALPVELPAAQVRPPNEGPLPSIHSIARKDNLLDPEGHQRIFKLLSEPGWQFGWKSQSSKDIYSFWHKHFAGPIRSRHREQMPGKDCAPELRESAPLIYSLWQGLQATLLQNHRLVRCYANAFSFGCEGTLHTDSRAPDNYTNIYYPNEEWHPDWGGETVFFNKDQTDIIGAVYPKPNRLLMFNGNIPHVARGVTRSCAGMRITLMFKTVWVR
jgi:SM-20-related protein